MAWGFSTLAIAVWLCPHALAASCGSHSCIQDDTSLLQVASSVTPANQRSEQHPFVLEAEEEAEALQKEVSQHFHPSPQVPEEETKTLKIEYSEDSESNAAEEFTNFVATNALSTEEWESRMIDTNGNELQSLPHEDRTAWPLTFLFSRKSVTSSSSQENLGLLEATDFLTDIDESTPGSDRTADSPDIVEWAGAQIAEVTSYLYSYKGCFKNSGKDRVEGHIPGKTIDQCDKLAKNDGKLYFGMEYPAGSSTLAYCLKMSALPTMTKMSDSDCGKKVSANNRLGGAHRLAVYDVKKTTTSLGGCIPDTWCHGTAPFCGGIAADCRASIGSFPLKYGKKCPAGGGATCWFGVKVECQTCKTKPKPAEAPQPSRIDKLITKIKKLIPWKKPKPAPTKKTGAGANIVTHGSGGWGGSCTCPDGTKYGVGDNNNNCGSLACVGGTSGKCNHKGGPWSGRKVQCAPGRGGGGGGVADAQMAVTKAEAASAAAHGDYVNATGEKQHTYEHIQKLLHYENSAKHNYTFFRNAAINFAAKKTRLNQTALKLLRQTADAKVEERIHVLAAQNMRIEAENARMNITYHQKALIDKEEALDWYREQYDNSLHVIDRSRAKLWQAQALAAQKAAQAKLLANVQNSGSAQNAAAAHQQELATNKEKAYMESSGLKSPAEVPAWVGR